MIVPLMGDRAPFATSGLKLLQPVGFKVVRVDPTSREVKVTDFIRNTKGKPASLLPGGQGLLERPIAVKFAPDGSMYVVDFGRMTVGKDGRIKVKPGTGKILRLAALPATKGHPASSEPTSQAKAKSQSAGQD
jgi:glucose/arabinose dehydrogenase